MSHATSSSLSSKPAPASATSTTTTQRGLLIVIEGLDRSGKTTQAAHLVDAVTAHHHQHNDHTDTTTSSSTSSSSSSPIVVHLQKFPDRTTPTGTLINDYLTRQTQQDDHAIHLLFSANRWEARDRLLARLRAGTTVIVDRYSFSGAVYSAAKRIPGLDLAWCWAMEVGLPRPDLVIFLDLDLDVARARGGWGEERYEVEDMQRRVRELYRDVLGRQQTTGQSERKGEKKNNDDDVDGKSKKGGHDSNEMMVRIVDAGVDVEAVKQKIWTCYLECLRAVFGTDGTATATEIGRLGPLKA